MESGLTVLICSLLFVLIVLFKQNVLIFVQSNLGNHTHSWLEEKLFRAYDLDWNGVIDIEEFQIIARQISPETFAKTGELKTNSEPEVGVLYINLQVQFSGIDVRDVVCSGNKSCLPPLSDMHQIDKTIIVSIESFNIFKPKYIGLEYSWYLYKGRLNDYSNYFSYLIKPYQQHYILYYLLFQFHWNVLFDMRHEHPYSVAMVTGISDTHVRVNFILTSEYQVNKPPEPSVWVKPGYFRGKIVFTRDLSSLTYFEIHLHDDLVQVEWLDEMTNSHKFRDVMVDVMQIHNVGVSYSYMIRDNKLVAVNSEDSGYSEMWYTYVHNWEELLRRQYFS